MILLFMSGKLAEIDLNGIKDIIVVGDLHGDYESFTKIKDIYNPDDVLIFLGDYIDRGPQGVEIIEGVIDLIENYENVVALKGNHEDYSSKGAPRSGPNTFVREVKLKKGDWSDYFIDFKENLLDKLYIAALIPEKILFVHGGISNDIKSIQDLKEPDHIIEKAILWNDPDEVEGEYPNHRGFGIKLFGPDITENVLKNIGANYIIRSHEPRKASKGPYPEQDGKIITTNSSSVYSDTPFFLKIPVNDIPDNGKEIEKYTVYL